MPDSKTTEELLDEIKSLKEILKAREAEIKEWQLKVLFAFINFFSINNL